MSNDLAVKTTQLTNAVKQMSDYLKGKIDDNTTQSNVSRKSAIAENIQKIDDAIYEKYISENGLKIFNQDVTPMVLKDWLLNKDCVKYRGKLWKEGNKIVDQYGQDMILRGVGLHHILQYKHLHTKELFECLKHYGVNMIRISVYLEDYNFGASNDEEGNQTLAVGYLNAKEETKQEVVRLVDICTELGMYVLIDWHVMGLGAGGYTPTPDIALHTDDAVEFFRWCCYQFDSYINILYELANEPYTNEEADLVDHIKRCKEALYKKFKSYIMVCGYGKHGTNALITACEDAGITYIFHSPHGYGKDCDYNYFVNLSKNKPIFSTEFGNAFEPKSDKVIGQYDVQVYNFMDALMNAKVPLSCWKFTDQDYGCCMLEHRDNKIDNEYYSDGFVYNDLTKDGKIYLDAYRYNFEKKTEEGTTFDLKYYNLLTYAVPDMVITPDDGDGKIKFKYAVKNRIFANIPITPGKTYEIQATGSDLNVSRIGATNKRVMQGFYGNMTGVALDTKILDSTDPFASHTFTAGVNDHFLHVFISKNGNADITVKMTRTD